MSSHQRKALRVTCCGVSVTGGAGDGCTVTVTGGGAADGTGATLVVAGTLDGPPGFDTHSTRPTRPATTTAHAVITATTPHTDRHGWRCGSSGSSTRGPAKTGGGSGC